VRGARLQPENRALGTRAHLRGARAPSFHLVESLYLILGWLV
jgi:hypothetical protein